MNNNSLSVFKYESQEIRVFGTNESPLFALVDVCKILELGNPSQVASRLDGDEKDTIILNEGMRNPELLVVTESGVFVADEYLEVS